MTTTMVLVPFICASVHQLMLYRQPEFDTYIMYTIMVVWVWKCCLL